MKYKWIIKQLEKECIKHLNKELGIPDVFCSLLVARNIKESEEAKCFLNPRLKNMHSPDLLYEMDKAVDKIAECIKKNGKIFLYGDYDVDGITSTSVLYECLNFLNARVDYYIPNRVREGYGLNVQAIELLHQQGANLIITVDCGISDHKPIERANELGMNVIVTDHHEIGETLPNAYAIVNPKDKRGNYPFKGIAGVGVAFKLAWALCQNFSDSNHKVTPEFRKYLLNAIALVALGTISDVAPLFDENRIIAKYGLNVLEKSDKVGIRVLKAQANISKASPLTAKHVGFCLAPRLNAMGRLSDSLECVKLLTTNDWELANELARKIEIQNRERKKVQEKIYNHAKRYIIENNLKNNMVLTLACEDWHPGVIGIIASRLQEEFYRPVLMIAINEGVGQGSGRSIEGFHLFKALQSVSQHLIGYGGHKFAAGFRVKKEDIPGLDKDINALAKQLLTDEDLKPSLTIDKEIELENITWDLVSLIEKMNPFGECNPEPVFVAKSLEVIKNPPPQRYGNRGSHLGFRVRRGDKVFRAIAFDFGTYHKEMMQNNHCDIVFNVKRNEWKGTESIQLHVKDIRCFTKTD